MNSVSSDIPVGTEFAGYRITRVIGRGGMSCVYAAEHIRLGRPVALKVLAPMLSADEAFRARFVRESQLAATLDHPNIVPIYDAGEADGVLYIAMRLVRGDDLGALIEREGPLSLGRALAIVEQVGGALDQAHTQGLIHRDVKPANILLERPSEWAYLTDFGVVKETSSRGLTKTGYFLGTFEYAAPEQIEGKDVDGRTDVYALGCVLYECLTAEAPFPAETEGSMIHAHLVEPPPRLTSKRPDLPPAINDVIAKAMAKTMEDRYSTCDELVRALRALATGGAQTADRAASMPQPIQGAPPTVLTGPAPPVDTSPPAAAAADPAPELGSRQPQTGSDGSAPAGGQVEATLPAPTDPRNPRTVALTPRRLAGGAVVVLALVAAAVAAAILLTQGGKTTGSATTGSTGGATTGASTTPTAAVAIGLPGVIPKPLFQHCKTAPPTNGASETANCTPPAGSTAFWPDSWTFSLYPSTAAALRGYNTLRVQNGIGTNFGRCDRTSWSGEGAWLHNPEPGAQPKKGGRRFCYFQGNVAVIVWLHAKLGQPNHIDMLGIARASGSDHFNLFGWYSFWHHTVGKCIAPGCVARLK